MNLTRLTAYVAVPAALTLAACGGGSSGTANFVGQNAQVRFVNAAPDIASADFYFFSTGSLKGSTPTVSSLAYGESSAFGQQAATAGQVAINTPNTQNAAAPPCSIPQFSNNGVFTIVLAGTGAKHTCLIYQDQPYGTQPQVRFHNASPAAASAPTLSTAIAYGAASAPVTPGMQIPQLGAAALGMNANSPSGATFTSVQPTSFTNTNAATGFGIGVPTTTGSPFTVLSSVQASAIYSPGTTTAQNSAGTVPFSGTFGGPGGVSLFAIDCTPGGAQPQGSTCAPLSSGGGVAVIGSYDTF